jgi:hypothetical protein
MPVMSVRSLLIYLSEMVMNPNACAGLTVSRSKWWIDRRGAYLIRGTVLEIAGGPVSSGLRLGSISATRFPLVYLTRQMAHYLVRCISALY